MVTAMIAWLRARWLKLAVALGVTATLAAAGCAQLAEKERELTFRVVPGDASWYSGLPQGVQELDLPVTADGRSQHIHAWWWQAARADAPAVLYLHGTRWNLTGQLFRIEQLRDFGFSVLAIDYRGFGRSEAGTPSEESVYEDARAAWTRLTQLQPDASRRYIYGHSLGGAVAIDLAAFLSAGHQAPPARGLIVESTFTTLADMARALSYDWLPVQWILSQKFDSMAKMREIRLPVLVVHGEADRYVPARFSKALYEAARDPKQLLLVEGATHNNSMRVGSADYRAALQSLFGLPEDEPATAPASARRPGRGSRAALP